MREEPALGRTQLSDYDYLLPPELIAAHPAPRRDASRLLVLDRPGGRSGDPNGLHFRHLRFSDLPSLLKPGDTVVVNDSQVIPARLKGRKPTGAQVELLLLRPAPRSSRADAPPDPKLWEARVRPGGKLKPGREVWVAGRRGRELSVEIVDSTPESNRIVRLRTDLPVMEALERHGRVPLPPYLGRDDEPADHERYQTVYAREPGSVAAPTAGLHFTKELIAELADRDVEVCSVTLHVGEGTFRPLSEEDIARRQLHAELFSVSPRTAELVNSTRERRGRVWAVGTTTVRSLESAAADGRVRAVEWGSTEIFIAPPYRFRAVDALITNFHLPRSSLLMLVAAFAGRRAVMAAYREAVERRYRFYSYGDAMVVVP